MKKKRSVIVVDDEGDFTEMVKLLLEKTGLFEVGVCNYGVHALEMIREWKPDLILLDIMMPGMDGTEIAAKLRQDKELCSIPVIFTTSLLTASEAARNPLIANYPFIAKPIGGGALVKRVMEFFKIGN